MILFGALLIYASLYFWVIFTNSVFCNLENWLFIFGVDIFLGGLLVKNLRLFYIFKNAMKLRKVNPLENWHLFLMIGGLMLVDGIKLFSFLFYFSSNINFSNYSAIVIIIWEAVFPIKAYRFTSIPVCFINTPQMKKIYLQLD